MVNDVLAWTFHLLLPPFLIVLLTTLVLASIGKSLGIRRLYVKTLIRVFEVRQLCQQPHLFDIQK